MIRIDGGVEMFKVSRGWWIVCVLSEHQWTPPVIAASPQNITAFILSIWGFAETDMKQLKI